MKTLNTGAALNSFLLPNPIITKVTIDSDNSNFKYSVDVEIQGTLTGSTKIKQSNFNIAIMMFDIRKNEKELLNMLNAFQAVNFRPIASDLILQTDPSGPDSVIQIFSFNELLGKTEVRVVTPQNGPKIWTLKVPSIEFISTKEKPHSVSFLAMAYKNITENTQLERRQYTNSTIKLINAGRSKRKLNIANYVDPKNPEKCLLYDYYSYDFAIAYSRGKAILNGSLWALPDGSIWTGATHWMPGDIYMPGRYHGDSRILPENRDVSLREISIPYGKIQDNTKTYADNWKYFGDVYAFQEEIGLLQEATNNKRSSSVLKISASPTAPICSDFTTMDDQFNFNTLLILDIMNLLKTYSSLSDAVRNLSEGPTSAIAEIFALTKFESIEVTRHKILNNNWLANPLTPELTTEPGEIPYILTNDAANAVGEVPLESIFTLYPENLKEIKNFSFQKNTESTLLKIISFKEEISADKTYNSKYRYSVKVRVRDGAVLYGRKLVFNFMEKYSIFTNWTHSAKGRSTFSSKKNFDNSILEPLLEAMIKALVFFSSKPLNYSAIKASLFMRTSSTTGNLQGIEFLKKTADDLLSSLRRMTDLNLTTKQVMQYKVNDDGAIVLKKVTPADGRDFVEKQTIFHDASGPMQATIIQFSQNLESEITNPHGGGYGYIDTNRPSLGSFKMISEPDFSLRCSREVGKFFDLNSLKDIPDTSIAIKKNQTRYWTPMSVNLGGKRGVLPFSIDDDTKEYQYRTLLDVLYFQQVRETTDNINIQNMRIVDNLTSITVEDNTILTQTTKEPLVDVGSLEERSCPPQEKPWNTLEIEQGAQMDRITSLDDYKASLAQNNNMSNSSIIRGILNSKVLGKKTPLPAIFSSARNASQRQRLTYGRNTPLQIINALLAFDTNLASSSTKKGTNNTALIKAMRKNDFNLRNWNVQQLSDYGIYYFNYDNMVEVQFLAKYSSLNGDEWLPLRNEAYENLMAAGSALFCRLVRRYDSKINQIRNEYIDLPIIDKYFIIQPSNSVNRILPPGFMNTKSPSQKKLYKITDITQKYSQDFYKFIKPSVEKIMGPPPKTNFTMKKTKYALNVFIEKNPNRLIIANKKTSLKTKASAQKTSSPTTKMPGGY